MNKVFMLLAAFAIVISVFGSMSEFRLGDGTESVLAKGHDGGDGGGGDCCDAPPPDDGPPPDGFDGGTKDGFDPSQSPDGLLPDTTTFPFEFPEGKGSLDGLLPDTTTFPVEFPEGKGSLDGLLPDTTTFPVEFFQGGEFSKDVGDFFQQGTEGEFHFDFDKEPPDGGFDPSAFSKEFLAENFDPTALKGDFGELFNRADFGKGQLDEIFSSGQHRPDDFGSLFDVKDFQAGDFGKFAAVGEEFVDFGGHFDQFFGERGDEAKAASLFFGDFNPGDFQSFDKEALLGQVHELDFQGFQELGKDVVLELFKDGLSGQQFDLEGQQWAGAFSQFDVQDIKGFDRGFIEDAVHDFSKADFLGIPDDQAFALFESTFFGEGGVGPGGPPPGFDPLEFAGKLDDFGDQLGGFMGAFGKDHYQQLGGDLVADMLDKIDFLGADFDPTVFSGEDVGHAFAALDFQKIQDLGGKVNEAIGNFESGDISQWDAQAAFNVFNAGEFDDVKKLGAIGGLVGAMGKDFLGQVDAGQRVELFQGLGLDLSGEDIEGLEGQDIAALMGGMGRDHLDQLGGQGIINAMSRIANLEDLGIMGGDTAFDVLGAVGLGEIQDIAQFDGLVANLRSEHIRGLGDKFGDVLDNLDLKANGGILGGFSFDVLDEIFGDGEVTLDGIFGDGGVTLEESKALGKLADLVNSVGGGRIFQLDSAKLEDLVGGLDPGGIANVDPAAVGGIFAGLNADQINGLDQETVDAAIDAAGADFLGGSGNFDGIAGGDTAFDQLADFAQGSGPNLLPGVPPPPPGSINIDEWIQYGYLGDIFPNWVGF